MYTIKKAKELTGGGISNSNRKMPGHTYGLSAIARPGKSCGMFLIQCVIYAMQ